MCGYIFLRFCKMGKVDPTLHHAFENETPCHIHTIYQCITQILQVKRTFDSELVNKRRDYDMVITLSTMCSKYWCTSKWWGWGWAVWSIYNSWSILSIMLCKTHACLQSTSLSRKVHFFAENILFSLAHHILSIMIIILFPAFFLQYAFT